MGHRFRHVPPQRTAEPSRRALIRPGAGPVPGTYVPPPQFIEFDTEPFDEADLRPSTHYAPVSGWYPPNRLKPIRQPGRLWDCAAAVCALAASWLALYLSWFWLARPWAVVSCILLFGVLQACGVRLIVKHERLQPRRRA